MKRLFSKLSPRWRWFLVLVVLLTLVVIQAPSLRHHLSDLVLGTPCNDLFDEINIHTTVTRNLLQGHHPFYSNNLDYPLDRNLLITHKTFLHILFAAPFIASLPWPLWWNVVLVLALVSGALAACYTLVKLGRSWPLGILLGISFLSWQWLRDMVAWGHLVQLWSAPLFLALLCLVLALRHTDNKRHCWGLGIFTVVTSLVFWIWGGALALLGLAALLFYWPNLQRRQLRSVIYTVLGTALVLFPIALYVVSLNPNLPTLERGGGVDENIKVQALYRASSNAVVRTGGQHFVTLPASDWVAPAAVLLPLVGLFCACFWRKEYLFWGSCAALFFVIGWGPYCAAGEYTFLDSSGRPVLLPFYYLMDWSGLGYRWQTPGTLTPVVMMCLALGVAVAWQEVRRAPAEVIKRQGIELLGTKQQGTERQGTKRRKDFLLRRLPALLAALVLLCSLLVLTVQGAEGAGQGNNANPEHAFFPSFSFPQPAFLPKIASLPPGALIELPLGFVGNVWQLQHLHHHPTCHGRHPLPTIMERNDFALWLYRLSRWQNRALPLNFVPDVQSTELCYGTRNLPAELCFAANRYPSLTRPLQREKVQEDYRVLREELQVRYAVLHRANCDWLAPEHGETTYKNLRNQMAQLGCTVLYEDEAATLYELPSAAAMASRWKQQPWDATLLPDSIETCTDAVPHGPIPE